MGLSLQSRFDRTARVLVLSSAEEERGSTDSVIHWKNT